MKKTSFQIFAILPILMATAMAAQANPSSSGVVSLSVLEGTEWVLAHMNREETVMDGAEVTLAFIDGRITGKSACNRYSAGIEEGDNAGDIKIGQSMSTMMACPDELMKVEREYLDALSQVTSFSFHAGSLALIGQKKDGTPFSMLFSRAEKDAPEETSTEETSN